jgi:hypothetical protein
VEAEAPRRTVWQRRIDPPNAQPLVDLIEYLGESRRREPGNSPSPGGEAPVCPHEMFAARAHDGQL